MIQTQIRMGSRGRNNNLGPGSYTKTQARSKDNKGMFLRTQRKFDPGKVPGPGHYLMEGKTGLEELKDKYSIPRAYRKLSAEHTKPDYDMTV